tara:strand:- start:2165 stop:2485 length:321 start_codon:yes stop_codon:yes gene_type:complete
MDPVQHIINENLWLIIGLGVTILIRETIVNIVTGIIYRLFTDIKEDDVVWIEGTRKCRIQRMGLNNIKLFMFDNKSKLIISYKALEQKGIEKTLGSNGNGNGNSKG